MNDEKFRVHEPGEITHFTMLHGDVGPDPKPSWLDALLDEMKKSNAESPRWRSVYPVDLPAS